MDSIHWDKLPPDVQRDQARNDLTIFARQFFPAYCRIPEFSKMHREIFARRLEKTATPLPDRRGALDVVLAPRGAAKSTMVSLIFPAHAIVYDLERYIVLISATQHQATQRLAALRAALLGNARLHALFPDRLPERPPRAGTRTLELGGVRVEAFSAGAELRGISHDAWRPTWIILDDVERSDRVRSARQRDRLADWFAEVVDNLGDAFTNIDLIGTLLHRDALPARLEKRPTVNHTKYAAIEREADAATLWDQWRVVFNNLANPDRVRAAFEFFSARREEMERGAAVLWPEKESYYDLQVLRETSGRNAFDREKQNTPWAEGEAAFAGINFRRFRVCGDCLVCDPPLAIPGAITPLESGPLEIPLSDLRVFGFFDPALGRAAGDFAAIATVGRDTHQYYYLLDVWLGRGGPSQQIQRIFELHERWNYELFGFEDNNFQQLLADPIRIESERRRGQGRRHHLPILGIHQAGNKQTRILKLEPLANGGSILLNENLSEEFMNQLLDFPNARHDDGPDAFAAAVQLAREATESTTPLRTVPHSQSRDESF